MDDLIVSIAVALGVGYLLGSVSFAVVVCRFYGVNIWEVGSGNPGATNVKRSVGGVAGNLVFLLDMLKGMLAAGWPLLFMVGLEGVFYVQIAGLVGAILGHSFSIFLKFRGGKGVAVTIGGLMAMVPFGLGLGLVAWLVLFYTTRYVSVASMGMSALLPVFVYFLGGNLEEVVFCAVLGAFVIYRHRANIRRLIRGEEYRFDKKDVDG